MNILYSRRRICDGATGNLTAIIERDAQGQQVGASTTFGYDRGRRTSATAPTGGTMSFAWQSTLPTRTTWAGPHTVPGVPGTVTLNGTVERFYNDFLEVSELHVAGGARTRLLRDRDGLLTSIEDFDGEFPTLTLARSPLDGHVTGTTLDTVTTNHVLDINETTPGFGDLLFMFADAGANNLYDTAYTYDDRGRIDTWTETLENDATRTRKFGYDPAGRLVTVHDTTGGEPGTLLEEYAYDGNGNRQKAFSNYPGAVPLDTELPTSIHCAGASGDTAADDQDRLCEYGGFTYSYNARGQLQSKTDGAITTTYTYDGLGRLKRVTEPGMDLHYIHDALGRRIGKVRDGNLEKGWLYADALNPIAELDGAGNVRATFIYGTRAHVPDAMVMNDGTVYRLITDHLGSVRLVVNAETGEVVQRMDYDAFGRVLQDTNPGFQPFGFAGGLYDDDTGLVRFGARDYDAYTGRWTAKDPVLFADGANAYSYVNGDSVNRIDLTGLSWLWYDRANNNLSVYDETGAFVEDFDASNRAKNPGANPWTPEGNGPIPSGEFRITGLDRGSRGQFPNGFFRIDLGQGPNGQQRKGVGIHGDAETNSTCARNAAQGIRPLWQCGTAGCIRMDTNDIQWLSNYHNNVDPITRIFVSD